MDEKELEALKAKVEKLDRLETVRDLPSAYLEKLREGAATATIFAKGPTLDKLNQFLATRGLQKVVGQDANAFALDDDIPF